VSKAERKTKYLAMLHDPSTMKKDLDEVAKLLNIPGRSHKNATQLKDLISIYLQESGGEINVEGYSLDLPEGGVKMSGSEKNAKWVAAKSRGRRAWTQLCNRYPELKG